MNYFFRLKIKDAAGKQLGEDYYIELKNIIVLENTQEAWAEGVKRTSGKLIKMEFPNAANVDFSLMYIMDKGITFKPINEADELKMQGSFKF